MSRPGEAIIMDPGMRGSKRAPQAHFARRASERPISARMPGADLAGTHQRLHLLGQRQEPKGVGDVVNLVSSCEEHATSEMPTEVAHRHVWGYDERCAIV